MDMAESRGLEPQAHVGVNGAHMIFISPATSLVLLSMVDDQGFEPWTYGLRDRRYYQLS